MSFSFAVNVNTGADDALARAFSELVQEMEKMMDTVARDQAALITRESVSKQQGIEKLEGEITQLKASLAQAEQAARQAAAAPVSFLDAPMPVGMVSERSALPFKCERTMEFHDGPVHAVAMQPGTDLTASASWDQTIKLYKLSTGDVVETLGNSEPHKMGGLYSVAFAKTNADVLGCTSCDHHVYLYNHRTGTQLKKLSGHMDEVNGIDFHSSQHVMCTASDDMEAMVWDFREGIMLRTLGKHTKQVYGATFLGDGTDLQDLVATCCFDTKTRIFDMRDKQIVTTLEQHNDDVIGITFSQDRQVLATGSDDGFICLWDPRTWKLQRKLNTRDGPNMAENEVKRVTISPGGGHLAAACSSNVALVYDLGTFEQTSRLTGHDECVFDVAWGKLPGSDKTMLVTASHDKKCKYWSAVGLP